MEHLTRALEEQEQRLKEIDEYLETIKPMLETREHVARLVFLLRQTLNLPLDQRRHPFDPLPQKRGRQPRGIK